MSLQRKSKNDSPPKISKSIAARKCARVEAWPWRRWLWQPTWAAGCALSARCKLPLRMLACAPCVSPPNSLLRPPATPPRAAQAGALAALLLCEAAPCAAVRGAALRCGAALRGATRRGAARRGAMRCGAVRRGAARCGACAAVRCDGARGGARVPWCGRAAPTGCTGWAWLRERLSF